MITGAARVAGVVGQPVAHSLSPLIHNAWIAAAGLDAAYVPFAPPREAFERFVDGCRGVLAGLNVTVPFKERALALADRVEPRARAAGAANVLVFDAEGSIEARNTDGLGLLEAFRRQAPDFAAAGGPVVILGAGGAARGAAAALLEAGAPEVRLVNRTWARAEALAAELAGTVRVFDKAAGPALADTVAVVNATTLGLGGGPVPLDWAGLPPTATAMDMVYQPLRTDFLREAAGRGHPTVDGLEMLIGQARPSFEAFFGRPPPEAVDVRLLALQALGEG